MTAQLQADIDRLVAAVFGGHTTDATVLAAALLDTADSDMGEEVDSGIFVTDESVQTAMEILSDTEGEEAGLGRPRCGAYLVPLRSPRRHPSCEYSDSHAA